jgi:hypothetical protein
LRFSKDVENCLISGNTVAGNWRSGGGVSALDASLQMVNCTIAGNFAGAGGGLNSTDSLTELINCILWGDSGGEISAWEGTLQLTFCDIQGGYPGEGNIDLDPDFSVTGGFHHLLHPGSPCVDTGDPAIIDRICDWNPHWPANFPDAARSDMGAYGGPENGAWVSG